MNPHQLELFYYVAKSKGVSRAARQMPYGIQQPSVSSQVNALERDLGVSLYERRPFKLTAAGAELFKFVEPFFGRLAEVREKIQGAAQIRIGASPIVFRDYLPPMLEVVQKRFPQLSMILRALNQPELIEAVEQDELDLLISLLPPKLGPALQAVEILELELVLLVARNSPFRNAKAKPIPAPLIALKPNEMICQLFQQTLGKLGHSWLPKIEMDSLDLIEKYAAEGFGVGLGIRAPLRKLPASLRVIELPHFPRLKMGVIYRKEPKCQGEVCQALLAEVKRALQLR